jgi:hypothetical protein
VNLYFFCPFKKSVSYFQDRQCSLTSPDKYGAAQYSIDLPQDNPYNNKLYICHNLKYNNANDQKEAMDLTLYQFRKLEFLCTSEGYVHDNNKSNFAMKVIKITFLCMFVGMPITCLLSLLVYTIHLKYRKPAAVLPAPIEL